VRGGVQCRASRQWNGCFGVRGSQKLLPLDGHPRYCLAYNFDIGKSAARRYCEAVLGEPMHERDLHSFCGAGRKQEDSSEGEGGVFVRESRKTFEQEGFSSVH